MAFNNIPSTDLSRFSIGEIVDLSGVSDFYNAGSSKWLKSATSTASSNLSNTTKTNLAAAGTATAPTVIAQSALSFSYNSFGFCATYPIQRISASSVSVVPAFYNGTTAVGVGVMTAAGLQAVATGQTSIVTPDAQAGTNVAVASNNTKIFSYCFTSATALNVSSTTNGTTWTAETVTGIPTFATDVTTYLSSSNGSSASFTLAATIGWRRTQDTGQACFNVFWCGARFLILAPGATNFVASLSTDGFTFGGDNTTAVLGATAQVRGASLQFYRNGNNCYLSVGTAHRFSTDGGVTWAASTFAAAPNANAFYLQFNQSTPAKLVIIPGTGGTTAYYSADSGATWSASRTLPNTNQNGGLYYKGSTLVTSNRSTLYYVSTDDGVTWTTPTFPIGVLGSSIMFFADANRFYAGVQGQAQLLTSSDAVTWTIVTLSQQFTLSTITTVVGSGILPFDSNTVVLLGYSNASGYNQTFFTTDGGVTWTGAQYTNSNTGAYWNVGNAFVTPDAGGVGFAFGSANLTAANCTNVLKADITAGGAFYRTGVTAIDPIRTGANSFVRVG
jgi:hypothetical protein